eukprot:gnl/Carplike_NY0171/4097_a5542_271.p1 GENE.gnl/Carplike_NY0171/4097_a5542_271~~gnl/Carplike_NY0171/4097_a5542_271.p1  ORF type:complete len:388 (-),score=132.71 gnl/Carplike_NY0171/4097_a5542_271:127-1263(-)
MMEDYDNTDDISPTTHDTPDKSEAIDGSSSSSVMSDPRDQKIIELVNSNRRHQLQLSKFRTRAISAEEQVETLQTQVEELSRQMKELEDMTVDVEKRQLRKKLHDSLQKHGSMVVENSKLKQENALLKHALSRELGDSWDLKDVLEKTSEWKGRSEQIALLKIRNAKLSAQVGGTESVKSKATRRLEATIQHKEKKRIERLQEAERKVTELEAELKESQDTAQAVIVRNRHVEKDVRDLRKKLAIVVKKTQHDNELIDGLRKRLSSGAGSEPSSSSAGTTAGTDMEILAERQESIIKTLREQLQAEKESVRRADVEVDRLHELCEEKKRELEEIKSQMEKGKKDAQDEKRRIVEMERELERRSTTGEDKKDSEKDIDE